MAPRKLRLGELHFGETESRRTSPDMSSISETYEDSVQIVENLIDSDLIDLNFLL